MGIFNSNKNQPIQREYEFYSLSQNAADIFMNWRREAFVSKDFSQIDEMLELLCQSTAWLQKDNNMIEIAISTTTSGPNRKKGALELAKYNATKRIMNECYEEACKIKISLLQQHFENIGASTFLQEYELIKFLANSRNKYGLGFQPSMEIAGHVQRDDWNEIGKKVADGTFSTDYYRQFRKVLKERAEKFNADLVARNSDFPHSYAFPGEDK